MDALLDGLQIDDEELTAQALAADPALALPDDAVSFDQLTGEDDFELLPVWYMPSPPAGGVRLEGWRRVLAVVVIGSILLLNAYGLCVIYGHVTVG